MSYTLRGTKDGGTRYDCSVATLQDLWAQHKWMIEQGYAVKVEFPENSPNNMEQLRQQLIDAAARSAQHNVPPPPSDSMKTDNVVPFRRREKTVTEYSPTEAADIFNEAMKRNKENRERLAKERAKNNKAVTRSYDLRTPPTTPKGGK